MHNNFIKHFIVGLIIFSNLSFGKEFNELFTIYEPIENSSSIESSINSSFNNLIFRVSGSNSPSNIWKIINSGSSRKDFITSYSIKNYDGNSFLEVKFNQDKVISKFKELSIPIISHSRPVIFFLIEVESGSETSYFISQESNTAFDNIFINTLDRLSKQRGIFLELPIFDLEDQRILSDSNILSSPKEYLISKYDFDNLLDIKLINLGFNEWSFSGDINAAISSGSYKTDIETIFLEHLESIISAALKDLVIDTTNVFVTKIHVRGINSYEDYKISKDKLLKLIAISDLEILSFKNNTIEYKATIMGDMNSLQRDVQNNSFFDINNLNKSEALNLVYLK
ncbi:DUF2066 domain-containing protein [Gammaproteobacteria bacterium]|nr:DUF2066 domain-containing protein [Gammaproteobacteria bacterium]MDC0401519.1 DUF2066 domain-containing protein [Gammaproteobacteria bacterium]MDC1075094.1 DUF2066 domain-containing protein [Gammaproteobacteria bacterium]